MMEKKAEWVCVNQNCSLEILMLNQNQTKDSAPICLCGSKMKRRYKTPRLRTLHDDEVRYASKLFPLKRAS